MLVSLALASAITCNLADKTRIELDINARYQCDNKGQKVQQGTFKGFDYRVDHALRAVTLSTPSQDYLIYCDTSNVCIVDHDVFSIGHNRNARKSTQEWMIEFKPNTMPGTEIKIIPDVVPASTLKHGTNINALVKSTIMAMRSRSTVSFTYTPLNTGVEQTTKLDLTGFDVAVTIMQALQQ
jgi:hypothetical protein